MRNAWQSLSAALLLVLVAGCASKSEPSQLPPVCRPVMLPAWVLEVDRQPSLLQNLDRIIEPSGPVSSDLNKP